MTAVDRRPASTLDTRAEERPVPRPHGRRVVDLDGQWGFIPHDVSPELPAPRASETITVRAEFTGAAPTVRIQR